MTMIVCKNFFCFLCLQLQLLKTFIQWNLSKADTYGTEVFVRLREVSALERFELKSSQIYGTAVLHWTHSHTDSSSPYLTMRMWNGEKEVIFYVMYQSILHQTLK